MKPKIPRKTKEKAILESLRRDLLNGVYPVQSKLPIHAQLARRFHAGGGTVQRAVNQLIREGFLEARRRRGTFVVGRPPHLRNYALVFHSEPANASWSKYYVALTNASVAIQQEDGCRMMLFYGIDRHTDTEDYQRLLSYIRAHRLAGIIFDNVPHNLVGTPLLEETDIPRLAFMSQSGLPRVMAMAFDSRTFADKALDHLASCGRKRVAIVSGPGGSGIEADYLDTSLAKRGMVSPSHWRIPVSHFAAEAASKVVQLLMQGSPDQRPDALIVADDNLVESALAGLVVSGIRVPQELDAVVHCNFPCPPMTVLPVKRLGYDIRHALRLCTEMIDRCRRGEHLPKFRMLTPVFAENLPRETKDGAPEARGTEPAAAIAGAERRVKR